MTPRDFCIYMKGALACVDDYDNLDFKRMEEELDGVDYSQPKPEQIAIAHELTKDEIIEMYMEIRRKEAKVMSQGWFFSYQYPQTLMWTTTDGKPPESQDPPSQPNGVPVAPKPNTPMCGGMIPEREM
jgi:hypothetical protein